MREVIAKVLEAESEAKRITDAGEIEAGRITAEARRKACDLRDRIRGESQAGIARLQADSSRDAGKEKQDRLARYAADIESRIKLDSSAREQAVMTALLHVTSAPSR